MVNIKYDITLKSGGTISVIGHELTIEDGLVKILYYDEEGIEYILFMCRLADMYTVVGGVINES